MKRIIPVLGAFGAIALGVGVADAKVIRLDQPAETFANDPVQHISPAFERVSIEDFGRADAPIPIDAVQGPPPPPGSIVLWNNGPLDNVTAHLAQVTPAGEAFLAADDYFIKYGDFHFIDTITVCFAVSTFYDGVMNKPTFELALHADCNGRPDPMLGPLVVMLPQNAVNMGPASFPGFNLWQVTFIVPPGGALVFAGQGTLWLCPYGIGDFQDGFYYWLSANNGIINGAQGQIKNGAEPWMDVQTCDCPGICTDFCFTITGRNCCLLKDNLPPDFVIALTDGAKSLQLKGALVDTSRAVDNFQVPPGPPREICAVEAWMATNCPLDKIFLEIYTNDCNMPAAKLYTIDLPEQPLAFDTGIDLDGCDIYYLFWPRIDNVLLAPGQDYWLSVVARGTGSILDKAFWIYREDQIPCHIMITEGKVKDVFVEGLEDFTFVSEATLGPPRDFVFTVFSNPPIPPREGDTETPGDSEGTSTPTQSPVLGSQSLSQPLTR